MPKPEQTTTKAHTQVASHYGVVWLKAYVAPLQTPVEKAQMPTPFLATADFAAAAVRRILQVRKDLPWRTARAQQALALRHGRFFEFFKGCDVSTCRHTTERQREEPQQRAACPLI